MPDPSKPETDRDLLRELYRIAVDEYRFNVKLGWDRAKFYVGLHTALGAASVALLRIDDGSTWPLVALSVIGAVAAWLGFSSLKTSHQYYRRSVFKKTVIEHSLGLTARLSHYSDSPATLAIGTTESQAKTEQILHSTEEWMNRRIEFKSVVGGIRAFLALLGLGHSVNFFVQLLVLLGIIRA